MNVLIACISSAIVLMLTWISFEITMFSFVPTFLQQKWQSRTSFIIRRSLLILTTMIILSFACYESDYMLFFGQIFLSFLLWNRFKRGFD